MQASVFLAGCIMSTFKLRAPCIICFRFNCMRPVEPTSESVLLQKPSHLYIISRQIFDWGRLGQRYLAHTLTFSDLQTPPSLSYKSRSILLYTYIYAKGSRMCMNYPQNSVTHIRDPLAYMDVYKIGLVGRYVLPKPTNLQYSSQPKPGRRLILTFRVQNQQGFHDDHSPTSQPCLQLCTMQTV